MKFYFSSFIAFISLFIFIFLASGYRIAVAQGDPLDFCSQTEFADSDICLQKASSGGKIDDPDNGIFTQIVKLIIYLTASVSVIFIIIGAFKYITSQGESSQIKSAKDSIMYALIGLFIAVSAFIIVSFVVSKT
jgi:hypothetical protein